MVAELFAQLVLALFQFAGELLCYFTGKVLLPVLTGGRVTVMPYGSLDGSLHGSLGASRWFTPYQRLPNGRIGLEGDFAVLIALIFWAAILVGTVLLLRGH
jgi:hypothetical protein